MLLKYLSTVSPPTFFSFPPKAVPDPLQMMFDPSNPFYSISTETVTSAVRLILCLIVQWLRKKIDSFCQGINSEFQFPEIFSI